MNRYPGLQQQLQEVASFLQRADRFLLVGHVDPDPDCIGSVLALDWALQQLNKKSIPVSPDPLQPNLSFLPGYERVRLPQQVTFDEWDVLVVIDCEPQRTGEVAGWTDRAMELVNIDHHVTNPGTTPIRYINSRAAAAGEMIYDLISAFKLEITTPAAMLLYTAIMADTGSFRFSNTNAHVLSVASDLVGRGAQPHVIAREIYDTRSWSYLQLLQRVLGTLQRSEDGAVAWMTLTKEELQAEGLKKNEAEGLIQYPRMVDGVEVAILFRELGPEEVKVSFRSREHVDVSALAQEFGGGGHPRAAGCTLRMPLYQAKNAVLAHLHGAFSAIGG